MCICVQISNKMKFILFFLAIVYCTVAMPADVPYEIFEELDISKIIPGNIYLEPENPADPSTLPTGRVIGGSEVTPNSVPYHAAVLINGNILCGGSLISTSRVLTAAHCTLLGSFVQVRLGAHAFNSNEATQVRITSTSIINHERYDVDAYAANDISVVLLPSAVTLNNNIQVIPLAPADGGTFAGATGFLTGWGRTTDASNDLSPVLRGVNLIILSNAVCTGFYGNSIIVSSICTSGTNPSASGTVGGCHGDSGGPLVAQGVQVGIVSFGSALCAAGNPTVFARISSFRNWIAQNAGV